MRTRDWLAMLLLAGVGTAAAADAEGPALVLRAGLQADDRSGFGVDAGLDWRLGSATWLGLDVARSDAGSDFSDIDTRFVGLRLSHRFDGPLGLHLGHEWWGDPAAAETRTVVAGASLGFEALRIGLEARFRDIEFDVQVPNPPGAPVVGACDGRDTGIGLSLRWSGERGGWYLRGTNYDYSQTMCRVGRFTFDVFNLPPQLILHRPALELLQASAVGRAHSFFERSWVAGVERRLGRVVASLEYANDVGAFDRLESETIAVGLVIETRRAFDWNLRVGVTDTELVGSTAYAGVGFYWYR